MAKRIIGQLPLGAYVYAIVVDGVERYIGKGRGIRAWKHEWVASGIMRRRDNGEAVRTYRVYNGLVKALQVGAKIDVVILCDDMTDEAAFEREVVEIANRAESGLLWNTKEGGDGWTAADRKANWTPEVKTKVIDGLRRYWSEHPDRTLQQSAWASELNSKLWSPESEFRLIQSERVRKWALTPDGSAELSRRATAMWTDEFRTKRSAETTAQMAQRWADPEQVNKAAERMSARWQDCAFRDEQRNKAAKREADPLFRERRLLSAGRPEVKRKIGAAMRKKWEDPEYRSKTTNSQSPEQRRAQGLKAWVTRRAKNSK